MKAIKRRMRRANELNRERADGNDIARLDPMQQHVAENSVLIKLVFRQSQREVRSVNRHIKSFQYVRQRAQVILVAVRENNRGDVVSIFFEGAEVRNRNVDAIDALFGKAHARIDDDHLVAKAQQSAIHPKLADAAEGNYFEDVRHL